MAYRGVQPARKREERIGGGNPFSIAIFRMIKRMSSQILGERVDNEDNHVMSVHTVTGGRRLTVVLVK